MAYFSKGGFTHDQLYNMPVWLRLFNFKQIESYIKAEKKEIDNAISKNKRKK